MKTDTPRVAKLRELVEEAGGPAAFASKYSKKGAEKGADKSIDETYVSQILNGHRSFGEKAARNMAERAGLHPGYFGNDIELTAEDIAWLEMKRKLSAENKRAVFNHGNSLAEHAKPKNNGTQ